MKYVTVTITAAHGMTQAQEYVKNLIGEFMDVPAHADAKHNLYKWNNLKKSPEEIKAFFEKKLHYKFNTYNDVYSHTGNKEIVSIDRKNPGSVEYRAIRKVRPR